MTFNMPTIAAGLLATQVFWVYVTSVSCRVPKPYKGDANTAAIREIFYKIGLYGNNQKFHDEILVIEGSNTSGKKCFDVTPMIESMQH